MVPYIKTAGEIKTKPTQHSVKALQQIGIQPDILLCRTEVALSSKLKEKIGLFCNLQQDAVITARDVETTYEVPLAFHEEGLDQKVVDSLKMWTKKADLSQWKDHRCGLKIHGLGRLI